MDQDEVACHALGERRMNYLNQVRCILDQMEDSPCSSQCTNASKPLLQYPGYVNRKNPEFKRPPFLSKCLQDEAASQECKQQQGPAPKNVQVSMYVHVPAQSQSAQDSHPEPRERMIPENRERPLYQKYEEEFKKRLSQNDQTYLC